LPGGARGPRETYLRLCSDYYKRQILIYQNWPQRRFDAMGYRSEKVFTDMNT